VSLATSSWDSRRTGRAPVRPALRLTVRLRLTVYYGTLFLVSGGGLLAISYTLVESDLPPSRPGAPSAPASAPPLASARPTPPDQLHEFLINTGLVLAVLVAISVWLGWLMAGRVLRPLQAITTATRQISEQNLHWRLALPGPSDEITELGDTIDGLLARLEGAFEAQRGFVANASHELRTPLAMIRTSLDVAARKSPPVSADMAILAGKVREGLDQAERLVGSFLTLARAQRGMITDQTAVWLPGLAASALEAQAPAAADRGLTVRSSGVHGETSVAGSRTLLSQMIGNVIDNAVRHNERGGFIHVTTEESGTVVRLVVESGGPVLDPAEVEQLAQPFRRLGPARTRSDGSFGLGLSIVDAIATAHQGTLRLQARPQGGLRVIIELPRAQTQAAA
jgi:signal transduction histidine kinase